MFLVSILFLKKKLHKTNVFYKNVGFFVIIFLGEFYEARKYS